MLLRAEFAARGQTEGEAMSETRYSHAALREAVKRAVELLDRRGEQPASEEWCRGYRREEALALVVEEWAKLYECESFRFPWRATEVFKAWSAHVEGYTWLGD
jgi:hypothetical protein